MFVRAQIVGRDEEFYPIAAASPFPDELHVRKCVDATEEVSSVLRSGAARSTLRERLRDVRVLATDLFSAFGSGPPSQISEDGTLVLEKIPQQLQVQAKQWFERFDR